VVLATFLLTEAGSPQDRISLGTGGAASRPLRRSPRRLLVGAAAALAILAHAPLAAAFCRTTTCDPNAGDSCRENSTGCIRDGVPLRWKTSPIVYRFYEGGSTKLEDEPMRKAIRRAFDTWSNVQCQAGRTSLRFREGDDILEDKPVGEKQGPDNFGIYFRDKEWPHDDADESIALTNQIYGKVTGTIEYADIEVNTHGTKFELTDENRDGTDLQAVMTHEVGHYIGLAHSNDADSIMVARYCQAGNDRCKGGIDKARDLAEDDEIAVCSGYPPGGEGTTPVSSCEQSPAPAPRIGDAVLAGGLLFLSGAIFRRRARRLRGD
jgi:hypothetical protein